MSYDLRIVRGPDWFDNPAHQITAEEWVSYINLDSELQRPEVHEYEHIFDHYFALLPPGPDDPEGWPWLHWAFGTISAKYPEERTVLKMIEVANHFGGYVIGDEGEVYSLGDDGEIQVSRK